MGTMLPPYFPARIPSDQMTMGLDNTLIPGSIPSSNASLLTMLMDKLKENNDDAITNSSAWDVVRKAITPSDDPTSMAMMFALGAKTPINTLEKVLPQGSKIVIRDIGGNTDVSIVKNMTQELKDYLTKHYKGVKIAEVEGNEAKWLDGYAGDLEHEKLIQAKIESMTKNPITEATPPTKGSTMPWGGKNWD